MSLHDLGYRGWDGQRSNLSWRWLTVASTGIRLVWRGTWIRRTFLFTWLPVLFFAIFFVLYEQSISQPELREPIEAMLSSQLGSNELVQAYLQSPSDVRNTVWGMLLLNFFRYPQSLAIVLLVGAIAPRLISYDLRSRGYLLYFSRPLTPLSYILGKSSIVWFYLCLVTTIPALILYGMGVLLSAEWRVVFDTWQLPLRILLASAILVIPTTALALAFSACTLESRYATLAWIATWVLGWVAYTVMPLVTSTSSELEAQFNRPEFRENFRPGRRGGRDRNGPQGTVSPSAGPEDDASKAVGLWERWEWISPYHSLGRVQVWAMGFDKTARTSVLPSASMLIVVTLGSWIITFRRIRGRLRI